MEGLRIIFKVDFHFSTIDWLVSVIIYLFSGREDLAVGLRPVPVGVLHVHLRLPLDARP